jgi:hypothetical protein
LLSDLNFVKPSLDALIWGNVEELISLNFHI